MAFGAQTWKVEIAPQVAPMIYGAYIDVSNYVDIGSLGSIKIQTEQSDFSVGVAKTSSITLNLKNDTGLFSDERKSDTIFTYKRAGSKVRVSYYEGLEEARYGSAIYGDSTYGGQVSIFTGIISTESPRTDVKTDFLSLSVLGYESIFENTAFSISDVNTTQSVRFIFENILNKPSITSLAVVSVSNFTVGVDFVLDNLDDFEDVDTVDEALKLLLRVSNSILVIQDDTIYISDKEPSTEVLYSFYGQASNLGIENIQDIANDSDGIPRTYNLWRWDPDTVEEGQPLPSPVQNTNSLDKYGLRKQIVGINGITATLERNLILNSYLDEYGVPKQELQLTTPTTSGTVILPLLGKVDIDYPTPLIPFGGGDLPIWGTSSMVWGTFDWSYTLFNYEILQTTKFKIIGIEFKLSKDLVTFNLREI